MSTDAPHTLDRATLIGLTADIINSYVQHNATPAADLLALLRSVHSTLSSLGQVVEAAPVVEKREPAVPIKKSVTEDYIICLEDGRKFRSMKRHLTGLGMTPDQYRSKWGLPADYPIVAPAYAAARSELAKTSGLGRKAPANALAA